MKNKISLVLLLLLTASSYAAELDLKRFEFQAPVIIQDGSQQLCRLHLTPAVYDKARTDLADIRLAGKSSQQIPYILERPRDSKDSIQYNPRIINRSTTDEKVSMVTIDFGKQTLKNLIEVVTSGQSFRRSVKVEGSNDNISFFIIVTDAFVFAIGNEKDNRFSEIELPANDYRYLRISVKPMSSETKSPVIENIKAFKTEEKLVNKISIDLDLLEQYEEEKTNSSVLVYDCGYKNLPVTRIELDILENAFYRYIVLEGRDQKTKMVPFTSEDNRQRLKEVKVPWRRIASTTIYKYQTPEGKIREKLFIRIPSGSFYRHLRLVVKNYDDNPITINKASAEMIPHHVIFDYAHDPKPTLYFGSEDATKPVYDIKRVILKPLEIPTRETALGQIIDNLLYRQMEETLPWTEKHRVLLMTVLVIVVLVMGIYILKSFKSIQHNDVISF
ncbi:MAG: DUF3999 family protein [Planctomycetota bacterium]